MKEYSLHNTAKVILLFEIILIYFVFIEKNCIFGLIILKTWENGGLIILKT